MDAMTRKGGLLYPMLVIAATAVIVFSVTGIATMMGWLPGALSTRDAAPGFEQPAPRSDANDPRPAPVAPREATSQAVPPAPAVVGVVESNVRVTDRGLAVEPQERRASAAP